MSKANGRRNGKLNENGKPGANGNYPPFREPTLSPEEFDSKAEEYFDKAGPRPTISGLAHHLGFESRQSFYDYAKRPGFSYTVKRARLRIEEAVELRLYEPGAGGAIFWLKNHEWTDRREFTGPDGKPLSLVAFVAELPDEVVRRVMALPEGERREELRRLAARASGDQLLLGAGS